MVIYYLNVFGNKSELFEFCLFPYLTTFFVSLLGLLILFCCKKKERKKCSVELNWNNVDQSALSLFRAYVCILCYNREDHRTWQKVYSVHVSHPTESNHHSWRLFYTSCSKRPKVVLSRYWNF